MKPLSSLLFSASLIVPALSACSGDDSDDSSSSSSDGTAPATDGATDSGTGAGSSSDTAGTDSGAGTDGSAGTGGSTDATTSAGTGGTSDSGASASASASGGTGGAHAGSCDGLDGGLQCWHAVNEFDTPMSIMEACTNAGGTYSAGDCPADGLVAICDQTPYKIFHYYEGIDLGLAEITCGQIGGIWMPQ